MYHLYINVSMYLLTYLSTYLEDINWIDGILKFFMLPKGDPHYLHVKYTYEYIFTIFCLFEIMIIYILHWKILLNKMFQYLEYTGGHLISSN